MQTTTEILKELIELAPSIYEGNKQRGFWEKGAGECKTERTVLIITELAEAVEAHRHGKQYNPKLRNDWFRDMPYDDNEIGFIFRNKGNYQGNYTGMLNVELLDEAQWLFIFKSQVKDTVEDEMADVVIRFLDTCQGFSLGLASAMGFISEEVLKEPIGFKNTSFIIGIHYLINRISVIAGYISDKETVNDNEGYYLNILQYQKSALANCFLDIVWFCQEHNIDIVQHVNWKLKYNATRPYKHGKKY